MNIQYLSPGTAWLEDVCVGTESAIVGDQVVTLFILQEEINEYGEEWYSLALRIGNSVEENVDWYFNGNSIESTGHIGISGLVAAKNLLAKFEAKTGNRSYDRFVYFNAADERRMRVYGFLTRLGYKFSDDRRFLTKKI